jgi:DNA-binding response OmpR family regulator/nitrogen-specific signal transduction histidine kinase
LLAAALETAERLEDQLRQAQKMEAIGLLAGGIAHDFNNLLTVMNGYNDILLASYDLPEEARRLLGIVRDAGSRAAALVRGLLAFSRRVPLDPRIADLNESVAELSALVSRLLPANIRFSTVLDPQLKMVLVDPGSMQQALLNLVVNSRDAMPTGGTIEIHTANLEMDTSSSATHPSLPAGNYVLLTVRDTGAGMDEETKQRLFEPFYTTKTPGAGTGLGLSMVQHIVQESGGFLAVESQQGDGTAVRIYLPCSTGKKAPEVAESKATPAGGRETVLIAEDNTEVRRMLCAMLAGLGYRVLEAASATEAAGLASGLAGSIDLLVADLVLADSTGVELAQQFQERQPGLPVLYISGYAKADALDGLPQSRVEFLAKPFSLTVFAERVRSILDKRQRRRILFVDDDAAVVLFASRILNDAGFEVLVGGNGNVALATAAAEHLDLVITDLVMPEREGLETIMRLRKSHPWLPVIAISGAFGGHFLKGASTLGACAALSKPFSGDELLAAVRGALGES